MSIEPHQHPANLLIVSAAEVERELSGRTKDVIDVIATAYVRHDEGHNINPDSCFLRFPGESSARIIALPAYLGSETPEASVAGIKWIASFPQNIAENLQRASAVLVLNDCRTGFPYAILESSRISAARTAASAAVAASALGEPPGTVGVVGRGLIARTIADHLAAVGRLAPGTRCYDLDPDSAAKLVFHIGNGAMMATLEEALACDLVVLATTAATPYVPEEFRLEPRQLVLNVSLRDLTPQTLVGCNNVLDDVEHCLKADTSPHLLEQLVGNRDFVTGTLGGVLRNRVALNPNLPTVFSPFGLGVLDLAVGSFVHRGCLRSGSGTRIPSFFGNTRRW